MISLQQGNCRKIKESEEETKMALSNLFGWKKSETEAGSACGAACGAADKPEEKPAACGTACGASDK